jgi:hypothetical protein
MVFYKFSFVIAREMGKVRIKDGWEMGHKSPSREGIWEVYLVSHLSSLPYLLCTRGMDG